MPLDAGVLQWVLSSHGLRAMRATMSMLVLCSVLLALVGGDDSCFFHHICSP